MKGENQLQEAVRKTLVKANEVIIGKEVINWTIPADDDSGNVCLVMILKWRKQQGSDTLKPSPGWTVRTVIDPTGKVLATQTD
tara:strand:- start:1925 stop:2173 length:249 start_codon:yes stop_codon:yes gene_type:complete